MNFLLNKIDTDLRRKVYEKTRDGKVHRKTNILIYKDSEKQKEKSFKDHVKENKKDKKIIIKATKLVEPSIKVEAEKDENCKISAYGTFLDIKK